MSIRVSGLSEQTSRKCITLAFHPHLFFFFFFFFFQPYVLDWSTLLCMLANGASLNAPDWPNSLMPPVVYFLNTSSMDPLVEFFSLEFPVE